MQTEALDYPLPRDLIATRPAEPRDSARLLVVRRSDESLEHRHVPGDVLVLNDTAVAPARLIGRRIDTRGRVEGLLLEPRPDGSWRVLLRSNGRLRSGVEIGLEGAGGGAPTCTLVLHERSGPEWIASVDPPDVAEEVLDRVGWTPLPPYILRARSDRGQTVDDARDRQWYQTVYAAPDHRRSVAAPTAGLHFTPSLLAAVETRGVTTLRVTLEVGPGTFRPVTADTVEQHVMHRERYRVPAATVDALRRRGDVRGEGRTGVRRDPALLAVGTTVVRALESLPDPIPETTGRLAGETDLLIAPPYAFRHVEGMLTNFHLPRSTLLALVAAMVGLERLLAVYREAIDRGYRFYSYGDAMLILP